MQPLWEQAVAENNIEIDYANIFIFGRRDRELTWPLDEKQGRELPVREKRGDQVTRYVAPHDVIERTSDRR